jgi:uncharacterized membrane protein YhaH (DUF805 family)
MNLFAYWSPSGRFTRLQWWRFQIWAMFGIILVVFASINIVNDMLRVVFIALAVAAFLLTWMIVGLKRLHDRNKSAWWLALFYAAPFLLHSSAYVGGPDYALYFSALAGVINLWALIELGFLRGSLGPNRFGDDPTGMELPPPLPAG